MYSTDGKLIETYTSIIRLKKAYGIHMHHKTLYRHISQGKLFNNHISSLIPLTFSDCSNLISQTISNTNPNKARKIKLINVFNPNLSKTLDSLTAAAAYIKTIDGSSDKATIRNYINSSNLYRKNWLISEI